MPTLLLAITLTCAPVQTARAQGYTDAQIETYARDHKVPEWMIAWCKRHC